MIDGRALPRALREALARIAARAATLDERAARQGPDAGAAPHPGAEARWRAAVAAGEPDFFARRLAWDGWAPDRLSWLADPPPPESLPRWASLLGEVLLLGEGGRQGEGAQGGDLLAGANQGEPGSEGGDPVPPDALPFEEALAPFLAVGRRGLGSEGGGVRDLAGLATPGAVDDLARALAARLSGIATPALWAAFEAGGEAGAAAAELGAAEVPGGDTPAAAPAGTSAPPRARYLAFVAALALPPSPGSGWLGIFEAWPVLGRLLGTALAQWIDASGELLDRFEADREALGAPGARMAAVAPSLSDPHGGGRTVCGLELEGGGAWIYKPRPLGADRALEALLAWLEARGLPDRPWTPALVDRGAYGWVERVAPAPCPDEAGVARFFRRAGVLLALVYALDGTDFHAENVIARGEHPVLVDLEGLLRPEVGGEPPRPPFADPWALAEQAEASVLRTLLLRYPVTGPGGEQRDWGGLSDDPTGLGRDLTAWDDVNTDRMRPRPAQEPLPRANLPLVGGRPQSPRPFAAALREGFREAYRLLQRPEEAPHPEGGEGPAPGASGLLHAGGPLAGLDDLRVRFFFRTTRHYEVLLRASLRPEALTDGLARSFVFDRLARTFRSSLERPRLWPLIAAEREALEAMDLPVFPVMAGSRDLGLGGDEAEGVTIRGAFGRSAAEGARARLASLSPRDLHLQEGLIALALAPPEVAEGLEVAEVLEGATDAGGESAQAGGARPRSEVPAGESGAEGESGGAGAASPAAAVPSSLEDEERRLLGAAALALASRLAPRAVPTDDGAVCWLGQAGGPGLLGHGLWDGAPGVALFLGAAVRMGGDPAWHGMALGSIAATRRVLPHAVPSVLLPTWGGALRAMVLLAGLLDEPALREEARAAAAALPLEAAIAGLGLPDASGGLAELLFGLLALHEATGEGLAPARAVGERLLALMVPTPQGPRAWRGAGGACLAGFSHGAAGIARALARLHAATGEPRYRDAALEGRAYEDALLDPATGNWPIVGTDRAFVAWCHGAPGVLSGRLPIRAWGGPPPVGVPEGASPPPPPFAPSPPDALSIALATTLAAPDSPLDLPCCGNAGRAEVLLTASRALGRPALAAAARALMLRRLAAEPLGEEPPRRELDLDPSFLRGLAGVGYGLLRLAAPEHLPGVLCP